MLKTLLNNLLDLFLPEKPLARVLRAMNADEFSARAARAEERTGKDTLSLFDYRTPLVKEAVWQLKYRGNKKIAALLATILYDELLAFLAEYADMFAFTEPLIIPIPLSQARERKRGYNQCNLLVDELMRIDTSSPIPPFKSGTAVKGVDQRLEKSGDSQVGRPVCVQRTGRNFSASKTALVKIKETQSQTKTENKKSRIKNLANCFAAKNPALVQGRNIILIDDVTTTGTTLAEARKTLLKAGARKVIAFTIAH